MLSTSLTWRCCEDLLCLVCVCECGICGTKCVLMRGYCSCEGLWCGVLCFVKYSMIMDKDVSVVVGWRQGVVVDGDDCGWFCVLKEVLVCSLVWGRGMDCGGCGWKNVGMVATQQMPCAVMCGYSACSTEIC